MKASESRCQECRDLVAPSELYEGLCERCEEDHLWCEVCRKWQAREDPSCRHLFWAEYDWSGTGADEGDWDSCRESFSWLLDLLITVPKEGRHGWDWSGKAPEPNLVTAIESRIQANNFWTFTHGFLLSMPDLDFREVRQDLPDCPGLTFARVDSHWPSLWQRDCHEKYASASIGFGWLTTLEAERTPAANTRTVTWIADWQKVQVGR